MPTTSPPSGSGTPSRTRAPLLVEEAVQAPATGQAIEELHLALARFWARADRTMACPPDSTWRAQFATSLAEVAANVVRHAYVPGAPTDFLQLRLRLYPNRAEATLTDAGIPYEPPSRPPATADRDLLDLAEGGWGLAIARAAVDDLRYRRMPGGKNRWQIVKRMARS